MHLDNQLEKQCIVVSGLPGSGKSTIGRQIANVLNFNFLDKDCYLEKLFRDKGTGDSAWRQKLSRESDRQFEYDAVRFENVVLVSHWRPIGADTQSGTPAEWLGEHFSNLVELYCVCPVEVAVDRFVRRERHPGHLDCRRTRQELSEWMAEYQNFLPLSLGMLVKFETGSDEKLSNLAERLREHVAIDA